eukprot:gene120-biopygen35
MWSSTFGVYTYEIVSHKRVSKIVPTIYSTHTAFPVRTPNSRDRVIKLPIRQRPLTRLRRAVSPSLPLLFARRAGQSGGDCWFYVQYSHARTMFGRGRRARKAALGAGTSPAITEAAGRALRDHDVQSRHSADELRRHGEAPAEAAGRPRGGGCGHPPRGPQHALRTRVTA